MTTAVITRKELFKDIIVLNCSGKCQNSHSIGSVLHEHPCTFLCGTPGCVHIINEDDLLPLDFSRICDGKSAMNIYFTFLLSQADLRVSIYMPPERHEVQGYMQSLRYFSRQDDGLVESSFSQSFRMERDGHDQRVVSDIEGWVCKFCH